MYRTTIIDYQGRLQKKLEQNLPILTDFLVEFLQNEVSDKGFDKALVCLSGGIDSAVTTYLCTKAFGAKNVYALKLPYKASHPDSLTHAQLVIDKLAINSETIDISAAVDGYAATVSTMNPHRRGNIMARVRMLVMFDKAFEYNALPIGTSNKTERLFGYYTWHDAADAAPINPLGDLFKTQVWALARYLGVPNEIINKTPSADLIPDQSDETDMGISYEKADTILVHHLAGYEDAYIASLGFTQTEINLVKNKITKTHWKRELPISAVVSGTAINEFYLRPVDY